MEKSRTKRSLNQEVGFHDRLSDGECFPIFSNVCCTPKEFVARLLVCSVFWILAHISCFSEF